MKKWLSALLILALAFSPILSMAEIAPVVPVAPVEPDAAQSTPAEPPSESESAVLPIDPVAPENEAEPEAMAGVVPIAPEILPVPDIVPDQEADMLSKGDITLNDYTYREVAGGVEVVSYNGTDTVLTIPSTVGDQTVVGVADHSYWGASITQVTLPNSVTYIGKFAFANTSLARINWPTNLTKIDECAFMSTKLGSVNLPNTLTVLGSQAFSNTTLSSVTLPSSIHDLGYAFTGASVGSMTVPSNLFAAPNYLSEKYRNTLPCFVNSSVKKLTITNAGGSTPMLDAACIGLDELESVTIEGGISSIGANAFGGCAELRTVSLGGGVTSIGANAFYELKKLKSVNLPSGLKTIGAYAFAVCSSLTDITLPASLTTLDPHAFSTCTSLKSITIPGSVAEVSMGAFNNCTSLETVTVEKGVLLLADYAFGGCTSLRKVVLPRTVYELRWPFSGSPYVSIYGYVDTAAEQFARSHNIPFYPLNEADDPVDKITIQIPKRQYTLMSGTTTPIAYTMASGSGAKYPINWKSDTPSIARVDADGVVTADMPGYTTITATVMSGNYPSASCEVYVYQKIASLRIAPSEMSIGLGQYGHPDLRCYPSMPVTIYEQINWSSANPNIAYIDPQHGTITGTGVGTTTITVALIDDPSISASCSVTVYGVGEGVESIYTDDNHASIGINEEKRLAATVYPKKAKDKRVTWSSSDESVASVSADGVVKGLTSGSATITATGSSGVSANCSVLVGAPKPVDSSSVSKLKLNKSKITVKHGGASQLRATISPASAKNATLSWTTSNPAVAMVGSDGRVIAVGPGSATIKATSPNGKKASCRVTVVRRKVSGIRFATASWTVSIAQSGALPKQILRQPTISPATATNKQLKWTSSNTKVATVSSGGVVTCVGKGKTTIKATARDGSGKKASYTLHVTD